MDSKDAVYHSIKDIWKHDKNWSKIAGKTQQKEEILLRTFQTSTDCRPTYCIIWIVSPELTFEKRVSITYCPIRNALKGGLTFEEGLTLGRGLTFQFIR